MRHAKISGDLQGPLLFLAVVIPVLALTGLKLHWDVAQAGHNAQNVRLAQTSRSRVLRYQIDEETGLRGYSATGDRLYLEPFFKAKVAMGDAFGQLRQDLAPLHLAGINSIVDREQRANRIWLTTIATPLSVTSVRSPTTLELQRRGKQIVDDFRNNDQLLARALDRAAAATDARIGRVISNTLLFVLATLAALCVGAGAFGFVQARTSRRAFENRLLYENEKRVADSLQEAFLNTSLPNSPTIRTARDIHSSESGSPSRWRLVRCFRVAR